MYMIGESPSDYKRDNRVRYYIKQDIKYWIFGHAYLEECEKQAIK